MNRLRLEMTPADMFVMAFHGVLDPAQSTLQYVRVGHNRPLHYCADTGECRFLTGHGMLLGMTEDVSFDEESVCLKSGDLPVLYSAGITDADSPSGDFFGTGRLRLAMSEAAGRSAQDARDLGFERVDRFCSGAVQYDDMALLVVRVKAPPWSAELTTAQRPAANRHADQHPVGRKAAPT